MDFAPTFVAVFSAKTLWIIWGLACVGWIGISAVLAYHWHSYSIDDPRVRWMKRLYFVGSLVLLASATTFIFSL